MAGGQDISETVNGILNTVSRISEAVSDVSDAVSSASEAVAAILYGKSGNYEGILRPSSKEIKRNNCVPMCARLKIYSRAALDAADSEFPGKKAARRQLF